MIPEEVLHIVLEKLDENGITYMVAGSFASNLHGVPRATQDADVIIESDKRSLERFIDALQDKFYADKNMAIDALLHRSMFNILHLDTGFKIDLIFLKRRDFSEEEFKRRRLSNFLGKDRWFTSPEDTILSKLEWSKLGESERQFNDAVNIAKIQGNKLDVQYLKQWANELDISKLLDKLFEVINSGE